MTQSTEKPSPRSKSFTGKRKRVRNWTSDDRAAHRVFERERRQAFNDNLIDLARQLPTLASTRRLNKHMIVQESLTRHRQQRELLLAASMQIQELINERNALLDDLNVWRATNIALFPPKLPCPVDETLLQNLSRLPHESFGTFPNGFGDNGSGEDQDESNVNQQNIQPEEAIYFTASGEDQDELNTNQQHLQPEEAIHFTHDEAEGSPQHRNSITHLPLTIDENDVVPEDYFTSSDNRAYYDPDFGGTLVPPAFVDFSIPLSQH